MTERSRPAGGSSTTRSQPTRRGGWQGWEDEQLRALVEQAWQLRQQGSPYLVDACQAIADWNERRYLRRFERGQAERAALVRLLRETAA